MFIIKSNFFPGTLVNNSRWDDPFHNDLKPNLGEIIINSPENKTYYKPDDGYYPASYGFECDLNGTAPKEWEDISDPNCSVRVISEIENHKYVLKFDDPSIYSGAKIQQNLSGSITSGTLELWVRISDASEFFLISFKRRDIQGSAVRMALYLNRWNYYEKGTWIPILGLPNPQDNFWHHVKIDFECSNGSYKALSQYTYRVIVDGIQSKLVPFSSNISYVNQTLLRTRDLTSDYEAFVDAVGYSWDLGYSMGSNMNEGLLLNYTNSSALEWVAYSLDAQLNVSMPGATAISMPSYGTHKLQLFGRSILGINYSSELVYFTIGIIKNKTTLLLFIYYLIATISLLGAIITILIIIKKNYYRKLDIEN